MKRLSVVLTLGVALAFLVIACESSVFGPGGPSNETASSPEADARGIAPGQASIIDITATHEAGQHLFELSDHEIPHGWTTFRFKNEAPVTHFVYAVRVPEGQEGLSREDYMQEVTFPFQEAWDPYFARDHDVETFFENLFGGLPEWFGDVTASGGPGLTGSGVTSMMTQYLEPGTYFVECYVLDSNGNFHSPLGMLEKLVVTDEDSGAPEPRADLELTISTDGIAFDANVRPGMHTVEIRFEDNAVYGHGLGHDVHLIRLDEGTTVTEVNDWMDYLDVGSDGFYADRGALMTTPSNPGPQTFLGGVQDIVGDSYPQTAYFHVNLKPGNYAWVAEVPDPQGEDMLQTFTVPFGQATGPR